MNTEAVLVREQLTLLSEGVVQNGVVLAQPNLIPHLPHGRKMFALGSKEVPSAPLTWS